jgi:hypothetical protein
VTLAGVSGGSVTDTMNVTLTASRKLVTPAYTDIDAFRIIPLDPGGLCGKTPWNVAMDDIAVVVTD